MKVCLRERNISANKYLVSICDVAAGAGEVLARVWRPGASLQKLGTDYLALILKRGSCVRYKVGLKCPLKSSSVFHWECCVLIGKNKRWRRSAKSNSDGKRVSCPHRSFGCYVDCFPISQWAATAQKVSLPLNLFFKNWGIIDIWHSIHFKDTLWWFNICIYCKMITTASVSLLFVFPVPRTEACTQDVFHWCVMAKNKLNWRLNWTQKLRFLLAWKCGFLWFQPWQVWLSLLEGKPCAPFVFNHLFVVG